MTQTGMRSFSLAVGLSAAMFAVGCAKKVAKATPPPAPPPAAPTATLAVNPAAIEQGHTAQLTWGTSNATEIKIEGLGTLPPSGSRTVEPNSSTTYNLVASGPGGTADASARVTVNARIAKATTSSPSEEDLFGKNVKDLFFDYDKFNIRTNEAPVTQQDVAFLSQHPSINVLIEGHCDDRGSEEYNLALGTSRAESVRQTLLQQGITSSRLRAITYGKERPFCTQDDEQCWQRNRVAHFTIDR